MNKSLDEKLISKICHDVRSPLTAINLVINTLGEEQQQQKEILKLVCQQLEELSDFVREYKQG